MLMEMKRRLQRMKAGQMFITLPIQIMKMMDWNKGDEIKFSFDKNKIILEKQ